MISYQRIASGLSESEVGTVVSALCAVAKPVEGWFLWRPQLRDPADEMVLEAAVNGRADALVTFNTRTADFFAEKGAEADVEAARRILRREGGKEPVPEDRR